MLTNTLMEREARESAAVVARQRTRTDRACRALATKLRTLAPPLLFTCARGSSDHAATYAKYLFETRLGVATVSQAPSVFSVYGGSLHALKGAPFLVMSQSGRSPDLLAAAQAARDAGALVIVLTNSPDSPLAQLADALLPLEAGPEQSVAATKSFIATVSALARLAALWAGDDALDAAHAALPEALDAAANADWSAAQAAFQAASSAFVLGRGLSLGMAQEAALKFKETSGVHAEAFSLAEVAHGPMALVKPGFPLLVLPPLDQAAQGLDDLLGRFAAQGAQLLAAGRTLPFDLTLHPVLAPIAQIQSVYPMMASLACARGYDPDSPPLLRKVTETI
jgi:glutamine---fructose-6-phosphate transaminase (isomerizing)